MASRGIVTIGNHLYHLSSKKVVEVVALANDRLTVLVDGKRFDVVRDDLNGIAIDDVLLEGLGFVLNYDVWVKDRVKVRRLHNAYWVQKFNTDGRLMICGYVDYLHNLENIVDILSYKKF